MYRKILYSLIAILSVSIRLFLNYRFELIPGTNGGYYPLQIRSLVQNGSLGLPDFPLYFWIGAFLSKFVAMLTSISMDSIILNISKILDSLMLPLSVIPLYFIVKFFSMQKSNKLIEILLIVFAVLSFSPFVLVGDLQKNAFAIPMFFSFMLFCFHFLKARKPAYLVGAVIFYVVIGLSHFGVFAVATLSLITLMLSDKKIKSILMMVGVVVVFLFITIILDSNRMVQLLDMGNTLFERPLLLTGRIPPPLLLNYIFSFIIIVIGFQLFYSSKNSLNIVERKISASLLIALVILSIPLYNEEYANRLSLVSFVIQTILIISIIKASSSTTTNVISIVLVMMIASPLLFQIPQTKVPVISEEAFSDLKNLNSRISNPRDTIIIARHGLEWWTGWYLNTYIAQDKAISDELFEKYKKVIVLQQKSGINQLNLGQGVPFHEPFVPPSSDKIYSSQYFEAYYLKKDNKTFRVLEY